MTSALIPFEILVHKVHQRLVAAGIANDQAFIEAEIMAEADLLGVPSHGIRMLPGLITALDAKHINAEPKILLEHNFGAISILNCNNGPGRYASLLAMQQASRQAEQFGVGVCLAKNTSHWGRAHAYASRAATAGFIGICTTNAMPTMAISGAKTAIIGNNPLAIGIPADKPNEPIVLDMAMSQAAVGKVSTWLREGKSLPDNWGINAEGEPTNDGQEILKGAVLPMGEHKGAGLAVMLELLTAALAGGAFTQDIKSRNQTGIDTDASKLFIALNPGAFMDGQQYRRNTSAFIEYLKNVTPSFSYPSERGWCTKKEQLENGVYIHQDIVVQLKEIGVEL